MNLKKNLIAFFVIGTLGTLGHFVYKWSGYSEILGYVFPVNESTWEHLKLLFFPSTAYFIIEYFTGEEKPKNFFSAVALSIAWGKFVIVALFYTVSGVLGFNVGFINILIYFIGVAATLCKKNKIIKSGKFDSKNAFAVSLLYLTISAILFILFSYNPPNLGIFENPIP